MTKEHYIKAVPDDVKNAMIQLEAKISSGTQTVPKLQAVCRGKCLILLCGEMAERLKAAVC